MTCDDFQIAFDQRRAGAKPAIPAAELDAHVAACAACTAYVALSEQVSTAMMTTISRSPAPFDIDAIFRRVAGLRRRMKRALMLVPLVAGVVVLGDLVAVGGFTRHAVIASLVGTAVGAIAAYAFLRLMLRRRLAALNALDRRSGAELVAGFRAELDRRIRGERQAWWLLPLLLVVLHLTFVGLVVPSLPWVLLEICYLAIPLPISIVRYRRLVRERALLGA